MKQLSPLSDDEILAALREVDVPEPSPLFWDHLSQRVREGVATEPAPALRWTSRVNLAWSAGVVGALAVVLLAVAVTTRQSPPTVNSAAPAVSSEVASAGNMLPPLEDDPAWAVMAELASQMDWDEAGAAGLVAAPGAAESALGQLSNDEQQTVIELLRQEMKSPEHL
jgi:hypothetical protein